MEDEQVELRERYSKERALYARLENILKDQVAHALGQEQISLGVPLESRVKSADSVIEKVMKRKTCPSYDELTDLVGIRCILLFRNDLERFDQLVKRTFTVLSHEKVGERLNSDQFGYQSNHYIVILPEDWLTLPSFRGLGDIKAEIQARTVSQHIWAAASHKLQYKHEESVPKPLRRSLSRVAALLETVDLEFDRFLSERDAYVSSIDNDANSQLNVDSLKSELESIWPTANSSPDTDHFEDLLIELLEVGFSNTHQLRAFLMRWRDAALQEERDAVAQYSLEDAHIVPWIDLDRLASGVYFTHTGLTRGALKAAHEAGEINWKRYFRPDR